MAEARWFTDTDAHGEEVLWSQEGDAQPQPVLYRHATHPAVWDAAVMVLVAPLVRRRVQVNRHILSDAAAMADLEARGWVYVGQPYAGGPAEFEAPDLPQ